MNNSHGAVNAAPLPWAMVPEFWSLPVIQRAGHHAAVVVLGLLIDAGRTMAQPGALPAEVVDPLRLARQMMLTEEMGRAGAVEAVEGWLREAVEAGALVEVDGGLWFGPGLWVDRRDVRRKLEADRKRAGRRRAKRGSVQADSAECPDGVRTMSGRCPDDVQQRVEKIRGDQISPPTPRGDSGSADAAAARPAGLASPDIDEGAERVASVVESLDAPDREGIAEAFAGLCAEFSRRGGLAARQRDGLMSALAGESTAVVRHLASRIRRGSEHVRSPAGYITAEADGRPSLLEEARAYVEAERREFADVRSTYTQRPDGRWETPEMREIREMRENAAAPDVVRAGFAAMLASLDGGAE